MFTLSTTSTGATPRGRLRRGAVALTLAGALSLGLAACGDDSSSGSPSAAHTASNGDVFNSADVQFATDMIQHHAAAIGMVAMADGRPLDPTMKKLTEQIREAQAPEIETMSDWLTAWDKPVPATVNDHAHGGHDMGDMSGMGDSDEGDSGMSMGADTGADMPGMMTSEQMSQLEQASDAEFPDMWLRMMVDHHRGAVEMAQDEVTNGIFKDAVALAKGIVSSQQAEIDQMEAMVG